jgi:hypothetical protein
VVSDRQRDCELHVNDDAAKEAPTIDTHACHRRTARDRGGRQCNDKSALVPNLDLVRDSGGTSWHRALTAQLFAGKNRQVGIRKPHWRQ